MAQAHAISAHLRRKKGTGVSNSHIMLPIRGKRTHLTAVSWSAAQVDEVAQVGAAVCAAEAATNKVARTVNDFKFNMM